MLSEFRTSGFRDGFWAEPNRFQYGARQELAAWRSTLFRHLPLISTFVRPLPILFEPKASKSMRKKSARVKHTMTVRRKIPGRSWNCETGIWISCRFRGSLSGHFRRYEVLPEPRGLRERRRLSDSCCLEPMPGRTPRRLRNVRLRLPKMRDGSSRF